jgi:phospholipid/cholesterol/gamma-HCH transport system substrate-binding protein
MKRINLEVIVGFFLIVGLVAFAFLAVKLGGLGTSTAGQNVFNARFTSSQGLKEGAAVEMAGVQVGEVISIDFDPEDYVSIVKFTVPKNVEVQDDAIASVASSGLLGGKYLKVSPGGSPIDLGDGDTLSETEPSISLEELIGKYMFEGGGSTE